MIASPSASNHATQRGFWGIAATMVLLTMLVSPDLMAGYSEINAYDEAKYIESGYLLLAGQVRELAWGPLVSLVYAPLHLVVGESLDWFILEAGLGRILMFLALLVSTYYLGLQLRVVMGRYCLLGVLFISSAYLEVLEQPSDALFVVFSALMMAKLMAFKERGQIANLAAASAFLGLTMLCRFESIVLVFALLLAVILKRTSLAASPARIALASGAPAALVLALYLLIFRITSPGSDLGLGSKAYAAFEANQPVQGPSTQAIRAERARALFGTREENRGSVLVAVRRNPQAFVQRVLTVAGRSPDLYLDVFGRRLGPAFMLFAALGGYSLLRRRDFGTNAVLALWGLVPMVGLSFQTFHIMRHATGLIHILTAVGATAVMREPSLGSRRVIAAGGSLVLVVYGLAGGKLALLVVGVVLLFALLLMALARPNHTAKAGSAMAGAMLLLAAGLILHGPYPFPDFSPIGESAEERVVHYLQGDFPTGSRILESLPLPALAAKMMDVPWSAAPDDLQGPTAFRKWLESERIVAVFLDERDVPRPDLVGLLEDGLGTEFEIGHRSEDGRLRVFIPGSVADG